jgi:hypothetical protein
VACAPKLDEKASQFIEAHNAQDIDAVLALFAEDASCDMMGEWSRRGTETIRQLEEWKFAANSQLFAGEPAVSGDTVSFALSEASDFLRMVGIDRASYASFVIVFEEGLIKQVSGRLTEENSAAISAGLEPLTRWAGVHAASSLSDLIVDATPVFSVDSYDGWRSLRDSWNGFEEDALVETVRYDGRGFHHEMYLSGSLGVIAKRTIHRNRSNPRQVTAEALAVYPNLGETVHIADFSGQYPDDDKATPDRMWVCLDQRGDVVTRDGNPVVVRTFPAEQQTTFRRQYDGAHIERQTTRISPCENCAGRTGLPECRFVW